MRLLLIEANLHFSSDLGPCLTAAGHAVDLAANLADGEWMARLHRYDAVIVDESTSGQTGTAVSARLRADGVGTPILVIAATTSTEDIVAAFDAGADGFLTKPASPAEVLARLQALTRCHRTGALPPIAASEQGEARREAERPVRAGRPRIRWFGGRSPAGKSAA